MEDYEIIRAMEYWQKFDNEIDDMLRGRFKGDKMLCEQKEIVEITLNIFDLINRQKAENKRLQKENKILSVNADNAFQEGLNEAQDLYAEQIKNKIRAEAIKEFAERLKGILSPYPDVPFREMVGSLDIDNLVKEMIGDATEPTKVSPHEICVVCGDQVPEGRQVCYMCETGQEFLSKKKE